MLHLSAQSSGFYALAYTVGAGVEGIAPGTTVISYRGTDKLWELADLNPWSDAPGGDIWNSYAQGAGLSLTSAAHLAADFFQAVTDTSETDPTTGSAILTGHSMGGGLAGFSALAERIAGRCCTNRGLSAVPLSPDGPILQPQ
jgi:alpha-beta hydrolase superfamily lysophospholipase